MLEIKNLSIKYFFGETALSSVSFTCNKDETVAVLGEEGSGKTTLVKTIAGLIPETSGTISLNGKNLTKRTPLKERNIQVLFNENSLYKHKSVRKNLEKIFKLHKKSKNNYINETNEIIKLFNLNYLENTPVFKLNIAEKIMLLFARLKTRTSELIIIDNIFDNLGSEERIQLFRRLFFDKNLFNPNCPVVFATNSVSEALSVGSKIVILRAGYLEQYDTKKQLINNPQTLYVDKLINSHRNFILIDKSNPLYPVSEGLKKENYPNIYCSYSLVETDNSGTTVKPTNMFFEKDGFLIESCAGMFFSKEIKDDYYVTISPSDLRYYSLKSEKRIDL